MADALTDEQTAEVVALAAAAGALVVGPDDRLVINIGTSSAATKATALASQLDEKVPELAGRVIVVAAEGMAVIRAQGPPPAA